jgi:hypothetical protein
VDWRQGADEIGSTRRPAGTPKKFSNKGHIREETWIVSSSLSHSCSDFLRWLKVAIRSPLNIRFSFGPQVSSAESAYVHETLTAILPAIKAVVGEPQGLDSLLINMFDGSGGGMSVGRPEMLIQHVRNGKNIDDDQDGR